MSYQDEAEAPFDPAYPDARIRVWGPPAEAHGGPQRICWENARQFAGSDPERYLYAEGLAFNRGEWSGHGWVVRKADDQVIECTAGYQTTTEYRGIQLEVAEVEAFIDARPPVAGRSCRERWHTLDEDGSVRSEAPGVTAILAEEVHMQGRDIQEFCHELDEWVSRGGLPTDDEP